MPTIHYRSRCSMVGTLRFTRTKATSPTSVAPSFSNAWRATRSRNVIRRMRFSCNASRSIRERSSAALQVVLEINCLLPSYFTALVPGDV